MTTSESPSTSSKRPFDSATVPSTSPSSATQRTSPTDPDSPPSPPSLPVAMAHEEDIPPSKRYKPSNKVCWIERLQVADVELQLVAQCLTNGERATVARVNKRWLHTVNQPFAWKAAPFLILLSSRPDRFSLVGSSSSVLRFAPIQLSLDSSLSAAQLASIPSGHLRSISQRFYNQKWNYGDRFLPAPQPWDELFTSPAFQSLEEVRCPGYAFSPSQLQLICALPNLRSLALGCPKEDDAYLQPLSGIPHLTQLYVHKGRSIQLISALTHCFQLRSLRLRESKLEQLGALRSVLCVPSLTHLTELRLSAPWQTPDDRQPDPPIISVTPSDWQAIWTHLRCLHTLTLEHIYHLNDLLMHLHHSASIRLLRLLQRGKFGRAYECESSWPTRETLIGLIHEAPQLDIRIELKRPSSAVRQLASPIHDWDMFRLMPTFSNLKRVTVTESEWPP